MKIFSCLMIFVTFLAPAIIMAESFETSKYYKAFIELPEQQRNDERNNQLHEMFLAEQQVKNIPFRLGDTMDTYLTKRASIPIAEDLGWQVRKKDNGYEVERTLFMEGKDYLHYTWFVATSGEITPVNDRTKKLHQMAKRKNTRLPEK